MNGKTVAGVAGLLLALAACSKSAAPAGGGTKPKPAYKVTAMTVATKPIEYAIDAVGSLEAYQVVTVPARVEGSLDRLDFDEGSAVTPETVLAVVDERRYSLVVDQAKAAVREADAAAKQAEAAVASAAARGARVSAELADAEASLERWQALRAKDAGFVTEEKLKNLDAGVKMLRASLDEAKAGENEAAARQREMDAAIESRQASVAIAEKNVEDTRVRSPIAGVVQKRHASAGQYVKVGDRIATLVDTSRLRLRFAVGEGESVKLRTGQPVTFRVQAFGRREFKAELFHIDATADMTTRMVECLAKIDDPGPDLRPGFFADVSVPAQHAGESIVVPEEALLATEKGFVAYVVADGRASQRPVKIGLHTKDGRIEILDGLAIGESLVVNGAQSLQEGVPVEVVAAAQKP